MFKTSTRGQQGQTSAAQTEADDKWKAAGFLNIYLPSRDGGKVKLGAIPLKKSNPREAELSDWLRDDPSADNARLNKLLMSLIIEYNVAEQTDAKNFALFDDDPVPGTGTQG